MQVHEYALKAGITRTKEFERKKLATHAVNIGVKCGHDCTYCSTGAMLRMHPAFKELGRNPFEQGYAIVDPTAPDRVAHDAARIRQRGMIQLCTTVDAWSPEAKQHNLGRRCLEAILAEPDWTVRILTKNASVIDDFDLIEQHRDRVTVGLSITGMPEQGDVLATIEPQASPIQQRVAALRQAHAHGLRTYAMFCPILPGIADAPEQLDELVKLAVACGAEEIFMEPINARGPGLRATQNALVSADSGPEAAAIERIRRKRDWSRYVVGLIQNMQRSVRAHADIAMLRILLYPSRLIPEDAVRIRRDEAGVIWLGKDATRTPADNAQS